jgi:hypothetical protein
MGSDGWRGRPPDGMMDGMRRRGFGMIKFARVVFVASATLFVGGWFASDAIAQTLTVEQFQHPKSDKDMNFNKTYLLGIKDGLMALNVSSEDKSFCIGGEIPDLPFDRASDILLHWARKRGGDAASLPLALAMLYSLKDAFPCKGSSR